MRVWRLAPSNTTATRDPLWPIFALSSRSQPPAILIVVPLLRCGPTSLDNIIHFPHPLAGSLLATGLRICDHASTGFILQHILCVPAKAFLLTVPRLATFPSLHFSYCCYFPSPSTAPRDCVLSKTEKFTLVLLLHRFLIHTRTNPLLFSLLHSPLLFTPTHSEPTQRYPPFQKLP